MKKIMLLGVACLLAGCVSLEKVSEEMNTKWAGRSYDEFVMENGAAKTSHTLSNGTTMYSWEKEGVDSYYNGGYGASSKRDYITVHCTLNILVDKNNNIKSIKASGHPGVCPRS